MIRIDAVWLSVAPLDMRVGIESALARVVNVFVAARPHHAYLFANRRANRMKVLVHDGIGVWMAARRLTQGKFVWPRDVAGIDVGGSMHFVAVPNEAAEQSVRQFGVYTRDLHEMADWLQACGVKIVAMESTGVYWIPLYELLERRGFEVMLVDARQVKNVSCRKSDVLDCQWIQPLLSYGLLKAAFRPQDQFCELSESNRLKTRLLADQGRSVQHMQKAT